MNVNRLASAIYNDIVSGLRGYKANPSINLQQLEDEIVATRLSIINLYFLKGVLQIKDLLYTINCVEVDCRDLNGHTVSHFEIPDIISELGKDAIVYIGSEDKLHPFNVIYNILDLDSYKYRKVKTNKPKVLISNSVNENGRLDCFLFNAPFISKIAVTAAFKDPRLIPNSCQSCSSSVEKITFLELLVAEKLTKDKINYYRQYAATIKPNNLLYE